MSTTPMPSLSSSQCTTTEWVINPLLLVYPVCWVLACFMEMPLAVHPSAPKQVAPIHHVSPTYWDDEEVTV